MADGQTNRAGHPMRTSPGRLNSGRSANAEPTSPSDQTPATIFGQATALTGTGLGGSGGRGTPGDVTQVSDQTKQSITGQTVDHGQTTLDGSKGASPQSGGETVTYTDQFAHVGGSANSAVTARVDIGKGTEAANPYGTSTLPGIAGNQPTDTGVGRGHASAHRP